MEFWQRSGDFAGACEMGRAKDLAGLHPSLTRRSVIVRHIRALARTATLTAPLLGDQAHSTMSGLHFHKLQDTQFGVGSI